MRLAVVSLFALSALPAFSQPDQDAPRFSIADIHPSGPALNPFTLVSGGILRGDRYDLGKATMLDLIRIAYQVAPETILGGPNWLEFDRFDIAAKAPAQSSPETVRRMLQSLLADRFRLAVHNDMRPMPAYVLSKRKGKLNITASSGTGDAECQWVQDPADSAFVTYTCHNIGMAALAARLRAVAGDYLKEPVIDATGLGGAWDLGLRWSRRAQVLPGGRERITIQQAIEKQLGLSLALRDAPAPVIVIDRVDKPTPNSPQASRELRHAEPAFEVASLKLNNDPQTLPFRVTRGGIDIPSAPLLTLLGMAWDMNTIHTRQRFVGLPKGIESVDVAIKARTTKDANAPALEEAAEVDDDLRAMVRTLLTDRFQIKWHYEDRLMEGHSLLSAKPKLKKANPANRASCHEARSLANDPRDTNLLLGMLLSCRNVTIAQFASRLQQIDNHEFVYPVEDATGIERVWDFDLSFTPGQVLERVTAGNGGEAEPNGAISLAEAINKQLGLKLVKRKRTLPAIVIDHMELAPTGN